jgi:hypothetical protein
MAPRHGLTPRPSAPVFAEIADVSRPMPAATPAATPRPTPAATPGADTVADAADAVAEEATSGPRTQVQNGELDGESRHQNRADPSKLLETPI